MKKVYLVSLIFIFVSCSHQVQYQKRSIAGVVSTDLAELEFWPYELEGCQNVRDEFLKKSSSKNVSFSKKWNQDCHVEKGQWIDMFTGEAITNASDVIVTTAVPMSHLVKKGLKEMLWPKVQGMMKDQDYLITLKKGGEGVKKYLSNSTSLIAIPEKDPSRCEYAGMWIQMKERWGLSFKKAERRKTDQLESECHDGEKYNRDDFNHWAVMPGQTCNTRVVSLKRDTKIAVTHENPNDPCSIVSTGKWYDYYSGTDITNAKIIDIDHFVPLKAAYISGAWALPQWRKKEYANYLVDPFHLVSVSAKENRSKSDKDPSKYLPPFEAFRCEYIAQWMHIKFRWGFRLSDDEDKTIREEALKCLDSEQKEIIQSLDLLRSYR
jgi:hypothetical protein